jgi:hypothetical protein
VKPRGDLMSMALSEPRRPTARAGLRAVAAAALPTTTASPPPLAPTASCGYKRRALPRSSPFFLLHPPPRRIASASHSHPASTPRAMLTPTTAPVTRAPPVSTFSSSLSWCPVREARQLIWRTRELPAARSVHHRAPR